MPKPTPTTIRIILEIEVMDPAIDYELAVNTWGPAQSAEEDANYRRDIVHERKLAELLRQNPESYRQLLINNLLPFLYTLENQDLGRKVSHGDDDTLLTRLVAELPQEDQAYFADSRLSSVERFEDRGAEVLVESGQDFIVRRVSVEDASGTILSSDDAPRRKKKQGRR